MATIEFNRSFRVDGEGIDLLTAAQFSRFFRFDYSKSDHYQVSDSSALDFTVVGRGERAEVLGAGFQFEYLNDRVITVTSGVVNEVLMSYISGEMVAVLKGLSLSISSWQECVQFGNREALNKLLFSSSDSYRLTDGDDNVRGFGGNDLINGFAGSDRLMGDRGADRLVGENGNDTLIGGDGRDRLTGGTGSDVFVFSKTAETGRTRTTRDMITDFELGVDDIDLSAVDANIRAGATGNQAFTFIGGDAFTGIAGQLRFAAGVVSGDVNGDGKVDFQIAVTGVTSMAEGDFIL